jgi:predicted Rossmann fold nucleotide-binding protein DprA/Smf involved in DNA uptake
MAQANLSAAELLPRLMMLELQGVVRSVPGGRYICLLPR